MDSRLILYLLWGIAVVLVWGWQFFSELRRFRHLPRDERRRTPQPYERLNLYRQRAFRELISDFALFLVALAAFASLVAFVIGQDIPGARGFFVALALGAFLGAGIVRLK